MAFSDPEFTAAMHFAVDAHDGQVDKAGEPYILHVLRVMLGVSTREQRIVALLHDTVEDKHTSLQEIEGRWGREIAEAINALTRRQTDAGNWPEWDYEAYIKRVAENPLAIPVKLSDLNDNMRIDRISQPSIKDYERWGRYDWARRFLVAV